MSDCTHDCSTCGEKCSERKIEKEKPESHSHIKKIYAIVSGKGGVGKSMVTSLLATMMSRQNKNVAILDADITGPSIPTSFGIQGQTYGCEYGILPIETNSGIKIISMNMFLESHSDPVVWRGSLISNTVLQFFKEVYWGDVDYMFIDMPPGTGDVPLTVFQSLPIDGIIVVTSPQELVSMIVDKAVNMAKMMNIPIVGIVENMSYFECPNCKEKHYIYGQSHVDDIAKDNKIPNVSKLPINSDLAKACDDGEIENIDVNYLDNLVKSLIK